MNRFHRWMALLVAAIPVSCGGGGTDGAGDGGGPTGPTCSLDWSTRGTVLTGGLPTAAFGGDVDDDGLADLVLVEQGRLRVLLRVGDSFSTPVDAFCPSDPAHVAVGDVNGDRFPDLVATLPDLAAIGVLLGTSGFDVFQPIYLLPAGRTPLGLALADFDGDLDLDLAVANEADDEVSILLGDGEGDFRAGPTPHMSVGDGPRGLAAFHANADGDLDLAVENAMEGSFDVFLGDGEGGFAHSLTFVTGPTPHMTVGDVNGDGFDDVVVASGVENPTTIGDPNKVPVDPNNPNLQVFLADGFGGFAPGTRMAVGALPGAPILGDWDGDGATDVAVPSPAWGSFDVFFGDPAAVDGTVCDEGPEELVAGFAMMDDARVGADALAVVLADGSVKILVDVGP